MPLIKSHRVSGAVLTVAAAVAGSAYVRHLIALAQGGEAQIHISRFGIIMAIAIALIGLVFLIFGESAAKIFPKDTNSINLIGAVVIFVMLAIGFVGYQYTIGLVEDYGYERVCTGCAP